VAYTSLLKRAIRTLWLTLDGMDSMWIPVHRTWRLNERHYGALQGMNKAETAKQYGDEQVLVWRRSYDTPPEPLDATDERFPGHDRRYADLSPEDIPHTECLKDTVERFMPCWENEIAPAIRSGKRVIIAAHGNSLLYELDADLKPISNRYLGDADAVAAAQQAVANQGKG